MSILKHSPARFVAPLLLLVLPVQALGAQGDSRDFLFSPPTVSVTVRAGVFDYQATGELFDFTRDRFTTEADDFRGGTLGVEVGVPITDRLGVTVGLDGGQVTVSHTSRDWVEVDGSEIVQSTRVRTGPAAQAGIKLYLRPTGDRIGQFAWVPTRLNVFGTAGVGVSAYEFRQFGDFVNEDGDEAWIGADDFHSEGAAFLRYAGGGAEVSLRRNLALAIEGRWQWGEDELDGDFRAFEPINLNGLRITGGLSIRF